MWSCSSAILFYVFVLETDMEKTLSWHSHYIHELKKKDDSDVQMYFIAVLSMAYNLFLSNNMNSLFQTGFVSCVNIT